MTAKHTPPRPTKATAYKPSVQTPRPKKTGLPPKAPMPKKPSK